MEPLGPPAAAAMGVSKLLPTLGISADRKNLAGMVALPPSGTPTLVEFAGEAHRHAIALARDAGHAEALALHTQRGEPLPDPGLAILVADSIATDLVDMAKALGRVVVVGEGKQAEDARPRLQPKDLLPGYIGESSSPSSSGICSRLGGAEERPE